MGNESSATGRILRGARQRAGLTQEQLAERAGIAPRTVRNLEQGRTRPRPGSLVALAAALGLDEEERRAVLAPAAPEPGPPVEVRAPVPRQLPLAGAGFSGRAAELADLDVMLATGRIAVIGGPAGVGKTTLALHWAHRSGERFPDGQLYVNLRGFAPGAAPATPERVLRDLLFALGVPQARMPEGGDELAKLLRGVLADRKILMVVDDARSVAQVRPLLPGNDSCAVLITSRAPLLGLVTVEGAHLVQLDVLDDAAAAALLERRLGAARLRDRAAVAAIVRRCSGLPLALAVVAARLTVRPALPLGAAAAELDAALDALGRWDPDADLRAVFAWSYAALGDGAARLFRHLGGHPGAHVTVEAAASLTGTEPSAAAAALRELTAVALLVEDEEGRFRDHDLLRAYARELADRVDGADAAASARARLLDHYLRTASRAAALLTPERPPVALPPPVPGARVTDLRDPEAAWAWLSHEHPALLEAARLDPEAIAWHLARSLTYFFGRSGRWYDWLEIQSVALEGARRSGDPVALTSALYGMGWVEAQLGRFAEADAHVAEAIATQPAGFDDELVPCWVLVRQRRWREALAAAERAGRAARARGSATGMADALNARAWCHANLDEYAEAEACARRSLTLHVREGTLMGEAKTLDTLGYTYERAGRPAEALAPLHRAHLIFERAGNRVHTAEVAGHLGDVLAALGRRAEAETHWRAALVVVERTNPRAAQELRARLATP